MVRNTGSVLSQGNGGQQNSGVVDETGGAKLGRQQQPGVPGGGGLEGFRVNQVNAVRDDERVSGQFVLDGSQYGGATAGGSGLAGPQRTGQGERRGPLRRVEIAVAAGPGQ